MAGIEIHERCWGCGETVPMMSPGRPAHHLKPAAAMTPFGSVGAHQACVASGSIRLRLGEVDPHLRTLLGRAYPFVSDAALAAEIRAALGAPPAPPPPAAPARPAAPATEPA